MTARKNEKTCTLPKRRQVLIGGSAALAASVTGSHVVRANVSEATDLRRNAKDPTCTFNVRQFGAWGDGQRDDTVPIQRALEECGRLGGGVVEVPAGQYLIKGHLDIPPAVTLEGIFRAPPSYRPTITTDGDVGIGNLCGSVLLAVEGAGNADGVPLISLHTNSTVKGITVFYPEQTKPHQPVAYPWTIAIAPGGAANAAVIDVLLINTYQAVDFGSYPSGRLLIRNLYADALYRGIYIDNCADVGRVENAHLYQFWQPGNDNDPASSFPFTYRNGQAFIVGRADTLQFLNCFATGYRVGFRFTRASPTDVTRGGPSPDIAAQIKAVDYSAGSAVITGGGVDQSDTPVLVEDTYVAAGLSFVNCSFSGYVKINATNRGMVHFTACNVIGWHRSDEAIVELAGSGRVSFCNCVINDFAPAFNKRKTAILHAKGGSFRVVGCTITSAANMSSQKADELAPIEQHIVIEPKVIAAVISSNDFSGRSLVENKSKGKVVVANNVEQTG